MPVRPSTGCTLQKSTADTHLSPHKKEQANPHKNAFMSPRSFPRFQLTVPMPRQGLLETSSPASNRPVPQLNAISSWGASTQSNTGTYLRIRHLHAVGACRGCSPNAQPQARGKSKSRRERKRKRRGKHKPKPKPKPKTRNSHIHRHTPTKTNKTHTQTPAKSFGVAKPS